MKISRLSILSVCAAVIIGFTGFTRQLKDEPVKPFVIQGQLINSPESELLIFFEDAFFQSVTDTIRLDEEGRFYLKTTKVLHPQRVSIQKNRTQINDIYVAPGYQLTVTADATDFSTLTHSLQIAGPGSVINQYKINKSRFYVTRNDTTQYWTLPPDGLIRYAAERRRLDDSIAGAVFGTPDRTDEYFDDFVRMIRMDHQFMHAYYIMSMIGEHALDLEQSIAFFREHVDPDVREDFGQNPLYLQSKDYRNWALSSYLQYQTALDARRDSTLTKQPGYQLNKMKETFSGPILDFSLYRTLSSSIYPINSLERLETMKPRLAPYIEAFQSAYYQDKVQEEITAKERELSSFQVGYPAPAFSLISDRGETVHLSDFKGKVVYIDFWASWCVPCRKEIPDFRKLYEHYKTDQRIAFIGIAVSDGREPWMKALEEDQPAWTQLYDGSRYMNSAYHIASIPRYVLIDKAGNLVNVDAPRPSDAETLRALLDREINK